MYIQNNPDIVILHTATLQHLCDIACKVPKFCIHNYKKDYLTEKWIIFYLIESSWKLYNKQTSIFKSLSICILSAMKTFVTGFLLLVLVTVTLGNPLSRPLQENANPGQENAHVNHYNRYYRYNYNNGKSFNNSYWYRVSFYIPGITLTSKRIHDPYNKRFPTSLTLQNYYRNSEMGNLTILS